MTIGAELVELAVKGQLAPPQTTTTAAAAAHAAVMELQAPPLVVA
jgi:hypothetical protein